MVKFFVPAQTAKQLFMYSVRISAAQTGEMRSVQLDAQPSRIGSGGMGGGRLQRPLDI
jgi:hypothetical protein